MGHQTFLQKCNAHPRFNSDSSQYGCLTSSTESKEKKAPVLQKSFNMMLPFPPESSRELIIRTQTWVRPFLRLAMPHCGREGSGGAVGGNGFMAELTLSISVSGMGIVC